MSKDWKKQYGELHEEFELLLKALDKVAEVALRVEERKHPAPVSNYYQKPVTPTTVMGGGKKRKR